jgi:hypothetical protein
MSQAPDVTAYLRPYDYRHDRYSAYYREGLRRYVVHRGGAYGEVAMGHHPRVLRLARRVRDAYRLRPLYARARWLQPALDGLAARIEGQVQLPAGVFVDAASHFVIVAPRGRPVRVCIDSDDSGARVDPDVLSWSDVYLKTNYWPSLQYAPKVLPFVNADPLVIPQLGVLRRRRSAPKHYDVCMVVRVWGGKDEVEGVEHNLRIIEAVARARGTKFLYAYLVAGDIEAARQRLARQGIPCGTDPIPAARLWQVTAESRLNVIRLGMHYCIPWRVTGALAVGSAIVLDRTPLTRWPEPLRVGVNYVALGIETGCDRPLGTPAQYAAIPDQIDAWLAEPDLSARIGQSNATYYDRFVDPERVGEQIIAAAERASSARVQSVSR